MKKKSQFLVLLLAITDIFFLNTITIFLISFKNHNLVLGGRYFAYLTFVNLSWIVIAFLINKYDLSFGKNLKIEIIDILKKTAFFIAFTSIFAFFYKDFLYSRLIVFGSGITFLMVQIISHLIIYKFLRSFRLNGNGKESVIIVGAGEIGRKVLDEITKNDLCYHVKFLGFLDDRDFDSKIPQPVEAINYVNDNFTAKNDDVFRLHNYESLNGTFFQYLQYSE